MSRKRESNRNYPARPPRLLTPHLYRIMHARQGTIRHPHRRNPLLSLFHSARIKHTQWRHNSRLVTFNVGDNGLIHPRTSPKTKSHIPFLERIIFWDPPANAVHGKPMTLTGRIHFRLETFIDYVASFFDYPLRISDIPQTQ